MINRYFNPTPASKARCRSAVRHAWRWAHPMTKGIRELAGLVACIAITSIGVVGCTSTRSATSFKCGNQAIAVTLAAVIWATDRNDRMPTNFISMKEELGSPSILLCPADRNRQQVQDWMSFRSDNCSYEILAPGISLAELGDRAFIRCTAISATPTLQCLMASRGATNISG